MAKICQVEEFIGFVADVGVASNIVTFLAINLIDGDSTDKGRLILICTCKYKSDTAELTNIIFSRDSNQEVIDTTTV